jgi:phosphoribosylaminoimidazolecarboxamide formyltransferase/IMP cyclohydrolase
MKTAFISVYDKTGIVEFADELTGLGFEIYSSGSTFKLLKQSEINVEEIDDVSPRCESVIKAISAAPDDSQSEELSIQNPYLVVSNLYPISRIVQQEDFSIEELPNYLDIWNSALIRTAARSFMDTVVLVDPKDYDTILNAIKEFGDLPLERKKQLASKAYHYCAYYDSTVAQYLSISQNFLEDELVMGLKKIDDLAYGENRHQKSAIYAMSGARPWGLTACNIIQGKPLNLNHYIDLDVAVELAGEFEEPACVIVKHSIPCAVVLDKDISQAFLLAFRSDIYGASGGTAAFNTSIDLKAAKTISQEFIECVVAPEYTKEAIDFLKLRKDLKIISIASRLVSANEIEIYSISGGVLIENKDLQTFSGQVEPVTKKVPSNMEMYSLKIASKVAKYAKSYAMVLVQGSQTIGIGTGQPSNYDSLKIAISKSKEKHPIITPHNPVVLASDTPLFIKCVAEAINAGVFSIIQPGGGREDTECIELCNQKNVSMAFTGLRHIKH